MALEPGVIGTVLRKLHELFEEDFILPRSLRGNIMFLIAELESLQNALLMVWSEKPADQLDEQEKLWSKHATELSSHIDGLVDKFLASISGARQSRPAAVAHSDFIGKIHLKLTTAKARHEFVGGIKNAKRLYKEFVRRHERYRIDSSVLPPRNVSDPYVDDSRDGINVELPKDGDLRKHRLPNRAQDDVAFLRAELEVVKVVLRKLAEVPADELDEGTKVWAEDLREVSCDIKQAFENFSKAPTAKARRRFAADLRDLKHCFSEVAERRQRYDLRELRAHRRTTGNTLSGGVGSWQDHGKLDVIDRQRVDELVSKLLMDEGSTSDQKIKLASIVGVAGAGKTTLANEVYRILKPQFQCTAWVSMRALSDMKRFLQDLLQQISQREGQHGVLEAMDVGEIINEIRRILRDKRYFIVVEDISDLAEWKMMKHVLSENNSGSAVLTTSNKVESAEDVGYVCRLSNVQDLCYNDLPHHLRPCILYLSMFQKGSEISGERLVWGWIAEGFIPETTGKSLQDVGESYICDLTERNLIEPVEVDACGKVISCRVYDSVHDQIKSKSIEEKFAIILDVGQATSLPEKVQRLSIQGNSADNPLPQIPLSDVRSLVLFGDPNLMPSLSDFRELRALDLGSCHSLQTHHLKGIEKSFLLKYLIIGGNCISGIPKEIVKLKLLQTLDLRASGLNELPESVFLLKRLERLCVNSHMKIPDGIGKMEALQELFDININKPELLKEICNLAKLRVLRIAIWSWDESLKRSAKQLQDNLCSLVQGRENIQSLSIYTYYSLDFMNELGNDWASPSLQKFEIRHSPFSTLPIWMQSLHSLSSLSIELYKLSKEIIDMLGKLGTLNSLSLTSKHAAEPEGKFGIDTDGFKNLTSFHFLSNAMTEIFAQTAEAMQMLKRVKLSFQASRTADVNQHFRFGLEHLRSLEHVNIEIICFNASRQVVQNAEDAIREAISRSHSHRPNLEVRRIRERDMVEKGVCNITEQEQHKEEPTKKEDKSCSTAVPTEGDRKYKIVSLDLESQILILRPI
ncbi:hypothetical protein ACP70R_008752 [Stipagrostis hirtigluma subsp. patula]